MILTGALIYVPPTSRAGIAILVCVIAIANLNYFKPHKNKVLFVLSQISFITTTAKYTVALLLSSSMKDSEGKLKIFYFNLFFVQLQTVVDFPQQMYSHFYFCTFLLCVLLLDAPHTFSIVHIIIILPHTCVHIRHTYYWYSVDWI